MPFLGVEGAGVLLPPSPHTPPLSQAQQLSAVRAASGAASALMAAAAPAAAVQGPAPSVLAQQPLKGPRHSGMGMSCRR